MNKNEGQLGRFYFKAENDSFYTADIRTYRQSWFYEHARRALERPDVTVTSDMSFFVFTGDGRPSHPVFTDAYNQTCTVPLLVNEADPSGAAILIPAREASWPAGGRFVSVGNRLPWSQRKSMRI
jgi:hypothetical protein